MVRSSCVKSWGVCTTAEVNSKPERRNSHSIRAASAKSSSTSRNLKGPFRVAGRLTSALTAGSARFLSPIACGKLVDHHPIHAQSFHRVAELVKVHRFLDVA